MLAFTSAPVFLSQDLSEMVIRLQRKNKIKIEEQESDCEIWKWWLRRLYCLDSRIGMRSLVI